MSKEKKARKARTPNVPNYTGPVQPAEGTAGGGNSLTARSAKAAASIPASTRTVARTEGIPADYTHIVSDLRRIGLVAGGLLVVLVILSFIIK